VGVGLYTGHATQPESTVSMTAICHRCSHTWLGPLVGHWGYVDAWGEHVGGILNDYAQTCAAAA